MEKVPSPAQGPHPTFLHQGPLYECLQGTRLAGNTVMQETSAILLDWLRLANGSPARFCEEEAEGLLG